MVELDGWVYDYNTVMFVERLFAASLLSCFVNMLFRYSVMVEEAPMTKC